MSSFIIFLIGFTLGAGLMLLVEMALADDDDPWSTT